MTSFSVTTIVKPIQQVSAASTSQNLETVFVEQFLEMIEPSSPATFASENREEKFSSFLRHEHAKIIVAKGGVGLSEMIIKSLSNPEAVTRD